MEIDQPRQERGATEVHDPGARRNIRVRNRLDAIAAHDNECRRLRRAAASVDEARGPDDDDGALHRRLSEEESSDEREREFHVANHSRSAEISSLG